MEHIDGDSMVQFLGDRKSKPRKQLGNKKIVQYWGVPKTNFDGKPPAHWGECLMNPDKLATLVPMGSPHVNWNDYFVVDKGIPRQGLGCQVLTYVFYDCPNNGKAITATGPEPAVGGSAGPAIGGPEPAIGGSVHPVYVLITECARIYQVRCYLNGCRHSEVPSRTRKVSNMRPV